MSSMLNSFLLKVSMASLVSLRNSVSSWDSSKSEEKEASSFWSNCQCAGFFVCTLTKKSPGRFLAVPRNCVAKLLLTCSSDEGPCSSASDALCAHGSSLMFQLTFFGVSQTPAHGARALPLSYTGLDQISDIFKHTIMKLTQLCMPRKKSRHLHIQTHISVPTHVHAQKNVHTLTVCLWSILSFIAFLLSIAFCSEVIIKPGTKGVRGKTIRIWRMRSLALLQLSFDLLNLIHSSELTTINGRLRETLSAVRKEGTRMDNNSKSATCVENSLRG